VNVLERNFFTDPEILQDPTPYYAALREHGPVWREPHQGVVILSGIEEILEVYADTERFSAIVGPLGPLVSVPSPAEGESWAKAVERCRPAMPMGDQLMTLDPPRHSRHRALAGKLFTPKRLAKNEEFIAAFADELIDEFVDRGEIEFNADYAKPFTLLVIADLLGVPPEDHETFRGWLGGERGTVGDPEGRHVGDQVFANLEPYFTRYIEQRRAAPGDDAMSRLAALRFSDGGLPEVIDVVRLASVMFAAGQETTARLLAAGMRLLCEQPALADDLRRDPEAIPNFIEECLRVEGPIKGSFRLALCDTSIGDVAIPAGSIVMAVIGAANRDPRVFDDPDRFNPKRPNARRNIAFGHGEHFCPGASLARTEARISFERLLARLDDLQLVNRDALSYLPTFILRGLNDLPMRFRRRA
jgi:cytochrome P450 family 150 subfamily A5